MRTNPSDLQSDTFQTFVIKRPYSLLHTAPSWCPSCCRCGSSGWPAPLCGPAVGLAPPTRAPSEPDAVHTGLILLECLECTIGSLGHPVRIKYK